MSRNNGEIEDNTPHPNPLPKHEDGGWGEGKRQWAKKVVEIGSLFRQRLPHRWSQNSWQRKLSEQHVANYFVRHSARLGLLAGFGSHT